MMVMPFWFSALALCAERSRGNRKTLMRPQYGQAITVHGAGRTDRYGVHALWGQVIHFDLPYQMDVENLFCSGIPSHQKISM